MESVTIGEGRENSVFETLDLADRDNKWVVINGIHLATPKLLQQLRYHLQHLAKVNGELYTSTLIYLIPHP